jgi:hypothetical protein
MGLDNLFDQIGKDLAFMDFDFPLGKQRQLRLHYFSKIKHKYFPFKE